MAGRWLIPFIVLMTAVQPAVHAVEISIQGGYAHNQSREGNHPAGSSLDYPRNPELSIHSGYLGLQLYKEVSSQMSLGIGARMVLDRWPMQQSNGFWQLDFAGIEYRPQKWLTLRLSGGIAKAYENKPSYGITYNIQALTPLGESLHLGLGFHVGEVNQEQGGALGGTDMEDGRVEAWALFLEYRMR